MPKRMLLSTAAVCLALGSLLPHWTESQEARPARPAADEDDKSGLRLPKSPLSVQRDWEYKQIWPCQAPRYGSAHEAERASAEASGAVAELNALGQRGWELVSFAAIAGPTRDCYVATFKRPLLH
jgi:hypothetical protein